MYCTPLDTYTHTYNTHKGVMDIQVFEIKAFDSLLVWLSWGSKQTREQKHDSEQQKALLFLSSLVLRNDMSESARMKPPLLLLPGISGYKTKT